MKSGGNRSAGQDVATSSQYWYEAFPRLSRELLGPEGSPHSTRSALRSVIGGAQYFTKPEELDGIVRLLVQVLTRQETEREAMRTLVHEPGVETALRALVDELGTLRTAGWTGVSTKSESKLTALLDESEDWERRREAGAPWSEVVGSDVCTIPGHMRALVARKGTRKYEIVDLYARVDGTGAQSRERGARARLSSYAPSATLIEHVAQRILRASSGEAGALRLRTLLVAQIPNPIGTPDNPERGRSLELSGLVATLGHACGWSLASDAPILVGTLELDETLETSAPLSSAAVRVGRVEELEPKLGAVLRHTESLVQQGDEQRWSGDGPSPVTVVIPRENRLEATPGERRLMSEIEDLGGAVRDASTVDEALKELPIRPGYRRSWSAPGGALASCLLMALVWVVVGERLIVGEYLADAAFRAKHSATSFLPLAALGALLPALAFGLSMALMRRSAEGSERKQRHAVSTQLLGIGVVATGFSGAYLFWWLAGLLPPWEVTDAFRGTGGAATRPFDVAKDLLGWYFLITVLVVLPTIHYLEVLEAQRRKLASGDLRDISLIAGTGQGASHGGFLAFVGRYQRVVLLFFSIAVPLVLVLRLMTDLMTSMSQNHSYVLSGHILFQMSFPAMLGLMLLLWASSQGGTHSPNARERK